MIAMLLSIGKTMRRVRIGTGISWKLGNWCLGRDF